jgi:hypothetical protein
MTARYYARSASDRTDDWPWWFVADKQLGGRNVTQEVHKLLNRPTQPGAVLCVRAYAEQLAGEANNVYGT